MKKIFFLFCLAIAVTNGQVSAAGQEGPFKIPSTFKDVCDPTAGLDQGYCIQLREPLGGIKFERTDASGVVQSIRGQTGIDVLGFYIAIIYQYGAAIIGIVCVAIIVISGIQIIAGGMNAEFVTQAKDRIMQALLSLALLFLSAVILKTINPEFFDWKDPPPMGDFETPGEDDDLPV